MREIYRSGITPQQKIVSVNQKLGNTGIKSQQGTSTIIYDTLPVTATTTSFRFFEDSSSRVFPFSNTGSDGNKLGVGDTMVLASIIFTIFDRNNTTGQWTLVTTLNQQSTNNNLSFINFQIANNQVIKRLALSEQSPFFNKDVSLTNNVVDLQTQIVIPPLLPYVLELQLPSAFIGVAGAGSTRYLECQIIGVGGIIAPRTTF
jgi:hypothetical protein